MGRDLTVALELTLIGAVDNGYGLEAFAAKELQVSGRNVSPTPRLGLESEVIPAWLRLRAGSYLEASRFPETSARLHGTAGFEVRVFAFRLSGHERRVSVSGASAPGRPVQEPRAFGRILELTETAASLAAWMRLVLRLWRSCRRF